jgi:hypothetical protein
MTRNSSSSCCNALTSSRDSCRSDCSSVLLRFRSSLSATSVSRTLVTSLPSSLMDRSACWVAASAKEICVGRWPAHSGVERLELCPCVLEDLLGEFEPVALLVLQIALEPADLRLQLGWAAVSASIQDTGSYAQHLSLSTPVRDSATRACARRASRSCCMSSRSCSAVLRRASHPSERAWCAERRATVERASCNSCRRVLFEASVTSALTRAWARPCGGGQRGWKRAGGWTSGPSRARRSSGSARPLG